MKYWTVMEVKHEVWKTMEALSELEIRENAQHKAAKKKSQESSQLFTLFRETMSKEVAEIHTIQVCGLSEFIYDMM